jgi:hypothetical protein
MPQFEGRLAQQDVKRHLPHAFEVPPDCRQITLRLDYTPPRVDAMRNRITLTLFDPHGFRGAGHRQGNHHAVQITATLATPGYCPADYDRPGFGRGPRRCYTREGGPGGSPCSRSGPTSPRGEKPCVLK